MKKILFLSSIIILTFLFIASNDGICQAKKQQKAKTQYKKEAGPPPWAPAHGYRAKTRYVYFSEHNFYYDNNSGVYIYLSGKNWEVSASIPDLFKNINLSAAVKIDLDFDADDPQKYNADHQKKYKKG